MFPTRTDYYQCLTAKWRNPLVNLVEIPRSCRSHGYVAKMVGINWSPVSEIISQTIWSIIASEIDFMIFHAIFYIMLPLLLKSTKDFKNCYLNCYWKFYRSDELLSEWWSWWFAMIFARCPVSYGVARERSRTPTIIPSRAPSAVIPSAVIPGASAWHGWTERTWKFCDGWNRKDELLDRKYILPH